MPGAKIAVCGCGHWGKNLARNFSELGVLAGVNDVDAAAASRVAGQYSVPVLSWDELIASSDIDGVAIVTPALLHARLGLEALRAGKHVFIEKPLALSHEDGVRLAQAARDAGRQLMAGHLLQYHPAFLVLKDMIASGEIGPLRYVHSSRLSLGKFWPEEGALWSLAPHDVSMLLALAGEDPSAVTCAPVSMLPGGEVDAAHLDLDFPSGLRGHISVSWLHPVKEQKLVAIGDGGMIVFDDRKDWAGKLTLYRHSVTWRDGVPEPVEGEAVPVPVEPGEPLRLECAHFVECVESGRAPRTGSGEALRVLAVLAAGSAAEGRNGAAVKPRVLAGRAGAGKPISVST